MSDFFENAFRYTPKRICVKGYNLIFTSISKQINGCLWMDMQRKTWIVASRTMIPLHTSIEQKVGAYEFNNN